MPQLLLIFLVAILAGCASQSPAPVIARSSTEVEASPAAAAVVPPGYYVVKKGDTLYRIALEHGQDYKEVVAWNKLADPSRIEVGQQLRVVPPEGAAVAVVKPVTGGGPVEVRPVGSVAPISGSTATLKHDPKGGKLPYSEENLASLRAAEAPATAPAAAATSAPAPAPAPAAETPVAAAPDEGIDWGWPAAGKLLAGFTDSGTTPNKGLDIAGKAGDAVQAAAAGKIVYVGSGLRGYGNLVIVRHNAMFLSAYAHNSRILVKEGASVGKGQKIAEIGSSDTDEPKLHFEIRRQGKPVDPAKYLPQR
ncbi:MAG: peptidoglycan DD-metalloendopeptidase family protein [Gammaproteobacteria bacterium]|nr:peptidoglycan DD-metalloendopeptidase family protein [Gammaproteobacteria bacterium]MBU1647312.1 peptidoglycan DD-metalloendopeptidase family protein [Gammaproteobacteria bacterium]MBU1973104.1 peptidoglycan DD-metalloendopeptidase family protein [Gammaproteobacteria bacterium]